jgi:hypothetical protein
VEKTVLFRKTQKMEASQAVDSAPFETTPILRPGASICLSVKLAALGEFGVRPSILSPENNFIANGNAPTRPFTPSSQSEVRHGIPRKIPAKSRLTISLKVPIMDDEESTDLIHADQAQSPVPLRIPVRGRMAVSGPIFPGPRLLYPSPTDQDTVMKDAAPLEAQFRPSSAPCAPTRRLHSEMAPVLSPMPMAPSTSILDDDMDEITSFRLDCARSCSPMLDPDPFPDPEKKRSLPRYLLHSHGPSLLAAKSRAAVFSAPTPKILSKYIPPSHPIV